MVEKKKGQRGGARPGSGRPKKYDDVRTFSFNAGEPIASYLRSLPNKSEYINECIEQRMRSEGVWLQPARERLRLVPFFNYGVACGDPALIEAQRPDGMINVPESKCPIGTCYVVRAQGESMLGAGIKSGDRLVIDPNDLEPGEHKPSLLDRCGEFTIKYLHVLKDGRRILMPDNPAFKPIVLGDEEECTIRGAVYANLDE